jgi:hypothetical protein
MKEIFTLFGKVILFCILIPFYLILIIGQLTILFIEWIHPELIILKDKIHARFISRSA